MHCARPLAYLFAPHWMPFSSNPTLQMVTAKKGDTIRASDIEKHHLDPSKFGVLTRAGYNNFVIQVIHLNTHFATKRHVKRTQNACTRRNKIKHEASLTSD